MSYPHWIPGTLSQSSPTLGPLQLHLVQPVRPPGQPSPSRPYFVLGLSLHTDSTSSFQGVVLIPLTFTPSNTPGSVRRASEEFPADITTIYVTETNMPDAIVPAAGYLSPDYVPSSRTNSPDPLPFRSPDADVPMAPYRSPSASATTLMPVPDLSTPHTDPISPTSVANLI